MATPRDKLLAELEFSSTNSNGSPSLLPQISFSSLNSVLSDLDVSNMRQLDDSVRVFASPRSSVTSPEPTSSSSSSSSSSPPVSLQAASRHKRSGSESSRGEPDMAFSRSGRLEQLMEHIDAKDGFQTIKKQTKMGTTFRIENYQLGEKLGKGAFGVVYKGLHVVTGQFVAVKRISRDKCDNRTLQKEVDFLKNCEHKNIVRYIDLLVSTNHLNLVLEFVDSGSLAQILAGYGFFPEQLAAIYVKQILEGLHYLHTSNVIHRDIKGSNLLITKEGVVKLADFGIATSTTEFNRSSLAEGSPFWMAPEIIELKTPTTASDIWSLGCTIIELLTGFPPYFDATPFTAMYKMVHDAHPPLPEEMTPELESFLKDCFQKDPNMRPSAADLIRHPWILRYVSDKSDFKVEDMRNTVKRYTLSKESGRQLASIDWDSPHPPSISVSTSTPSSPHSSPTSPSSHPISSSAPVTPHGSPESPSPSSSNGKHTAAGSPLALNSLSSKTGEGVAVQIEDPSSSERRSSESKRGNGSTRKKPAELDESIDDHSGSNTLKRRKKSWLPWKKDKKDLGSGSMEGPEFSITIYSAENRRTLFAFTVYKIRITHGSESWEVEKTWSDFKDFHTKLEKLFTSLPECPPRKFWGVMDPDFIRRRWADLQEYTNALIRTKDVADSDVFYQFFAHSQ